MNESAPLPHQVPARPCGLAIASLVLGVASVASLFGFPLLLLACIPGVIAGHMARSRIRKSHATLTGNSMAFTGLILSYLTLFFICAGYDPSPRSLNHAKKISSIATARALENAVNNFHTHYGSLPEVPNKLETNVGEGVRLLNILLGFEPPSGKLQNPRMIRFLTTVETKTKAKGLLYTASGRSAAGLYDSWGNPFTVMLAKPDQEALQVTLGAKTETLHGRRVAVVSPGADKKFGTTDDVKTW